MDMPSLFCGTPHGGLTPILKHLESQVIPLWKSRDIFHRISFGDPREGSYSHSLILVDPTKEAALPPSPGLTTYLYFTPSAIVDSQVYQRLGDPHMGVASSGMVVGSLLNSIPPNPLPSLFRLLRLMKATPLGVVSPGFTLHSRRESGYNRGQLRQRDLPWVKPGEIAILVTRDGVQASPTTSGDRALELAAWMKLNSKTRVHICVEGLPQSALDPVLLEGNGLQSPEDIRCIPEITSPSGYAGFDAAVGLVSECYFPVSLCQAAASGVPTFAPETHTWQEAITHLGTVAIPCPYLQRTSSGYTLAVNPADVGTKVLAVLDGINPSASKDTRGFQQGALSIPKFSSDLLSLMGLV